MLKSAILFLALALVAGLLGFTNLGGAEMGTAKTACFVFLALFVVTLIVWLKRGRQAQFHGRLGVPPLHSPRAAQRH